MEPIYANPENTKYDDKYHTDFKRTEKRRHGAVVLCLGLLTVFLLAGLIGLSVHNHKSARGAAAEFSTMKTNLTELLQNSENKVSSLTEERHQLNDRLSSLTEERDQLNMSLIKTTEELNRLQSLSRQRKTCPAGWTMFSWSCYLLSTESGSWTKGRDECRSKGAGLVVIGSAEEQAFISEFARNDAWIGLSDADNEGTWKWIDGTPLTLKYWEQQEPNNGGIHGNEDCSQIRTQKGVWNDLPCGASLLWICEL